MLSSTSARDGVVDPAVRGAGEPRRDPEVALRKRGTLTGLIQSLVGRKTR